MSSYIIPDIHGCLITLKHLLEEELRVEKEDKIYFLGDYVDRGPYSAQLIDYLLDFREKGYKLKFIRGNHEQMILDAMKSVSAFDIWMYNEGKITLKSYKELLGFFFTFPNDLPDRHFFFFSKLLHSIEIESKYILVHAGLNFGSKAPMKDKEAMLWSRPRYIPEDFMPGKVIIHGHTPTPIGTIQKILDDPKSRLIPLDAGCVYGNIYPGLGCLVALNLDNFSLHSVKKMEK